MITKVFAGCPKFKCNLRHSRNYEHKFYGKINANVLWIRIPPNIPKTKAQFNYESNRPTTSSLTRPIFPFLLTQTLRKSFLKSAFDFPTLPPSSLIDKHFCLCKRHTHAIIVLHHRRYVLSKGLLFLKNGTTPASFFVYLSVFSNKQYNFFNKLMWKNVHPVYGAGIRNHNLSNISRHPLPLDQGLLTCV